MESKVDSAQAPTHLSSADSQGHAPVFEEAEDLQAATVDALDRTL